MKNSGSPLRLRISMKFCVCMGTDTIWQEHLLLVIDHKKEQCETLLLLPMTICFMSNQICRVGDGLIFLFRFTCVTSLPEVITPHYSSLLCHFVVAKQHSFGIARIHYSVDTRL